MQNVITIEKVNNTYIDVCVSNQADGTNGITIEIYPVNADNPQLKVFLNGTLKSSVNLTNNTYNMIPIDSSLFVSDGEITFAYVEEGSVDIFTIYFPNNLYGNLMVSKTADYTFEARYTIESSGDISDNSVDVISTETADYPEVVAGNKVSVIIGKIKKFLNDLKSKKVDKAGDTMTGKLNADGGIASTGFTASKLLVSDANKNIVSGGLAESDLITTSNIGSQSVNYATSAGSAGSAGSATQASYSQYLRSFQNGGTIYADNVYLLRSRYNKWSDGRFGLEIINNTSSDTGTHGVRVDYAGNAYAAGSLGNKDSSDKNSVNGNGWYSVGESKNNVDHGGGAHHVLAINWYFGIDIRTGGNSWLRLNGNTLVTSAGGSMTDWLTFSTQKGVRINNQSQFTNLGTASAVLCANNGAFIRRYDNTNTAAQINASAFNTASSRLVKDNIRPIDDEIIEKVLQLDVKSFDYNGKTRVEKNQIGMIAEDVLDILPQFVHVPENYDEEETKRKLDNNEFVETLSIDYSNFVPALIKIVQMQQNQINELRELIKGGK